MARSSGVRVNLYTFTRIIVDCKACGIWIGSDFWALRAVSKAENPKGTKIFKNLAQNSGTKFVADWGKFQSHAIFLFLDGFSQELVSGAVRFFCFGFYFFPMSPVPLMAAAQV